MRHNLAAAVARRPDDNLGIDLVRKLGDGVGPGNRRVLPQPWIVGHMQRAHAV